VTGQIAASVCVLAGIAGATLILRPKPRRYPPFVVAMLAACAGLVVAGLTGFDGTPLAMPAVSESLLVLNCILLIAGSFLAHSEAHAREKAVRQVIADSESRRREVDRLGAINVRLEDELTQAKARIETSSSESAQARSAREAATARQRKAVEEAQAGEKRYRAVFEGATEGMALLDRDTLKFLAANPNFVRMSGYEADELMTRALTDVCADGAGKPSKLDLQRAARERHGLAVDLLRKDGAVLPTEATVTVVGATTEAQLLAVLRDTSARRQVDHESEQQLRALKLSNRELTDRASRVEESNAKLVEMASRKDHFVSTVSHELRTPLTSIGSFSEILLNHGEVEPNVRKEFLEIIHRESGRLTRLVTDVLDLARIEAGEASLDLREFDVRDVVADAVASVSGMAVERSVDVKVKAPGTPRTVFGDRDKLQQLLINLVSNAVKFGPEGGEVQVVVKDAEKHRVEIAVSDQGPGIAPADLEHVFEKFRRGDDAPASGVPGSGLGLAICREIATLHGGRVWAESAQGGGGRFRVELPGVEEGRRVFANGATPPVLKPTTSAAGKPAARATVTRELPAVGRGAAERRARADTGPVPAGAKSDDEWSTTGSLPPLRAAAKAASRESGPATGELPPIR
jgi:PAS domain S-box-containing protein